MPFATNPTAVVTPLTPAELLQGLTCDAVSLGRLNGLFKQVIDAQEAEEFSRPLSLKSYGTLGEACPVAPAALAAKIARDNAAFAAAKIDMLATGRPLHIPTGFYCVDVSPLTFTLSEYWTYQNVFCSGPRIFGDGQGRTVIDSRIPNGWVFDLDNDNDHLTGFKGIVGGSFGSLTLLQSVNVPNSNGARVRVTYQFRFHDLHFIGLSGTGIKCRNDSATAGDLDANNQIEISHARIENCKGWGLDTGSSGANNENSFLKLSEVFVQNCGTNAQKTITGITTAATAVVTSAAHGFVNDDKIYIGGVGIGQLGMSAINSYFAETPYTVKNATANTFEVWNATGSAPVNSTGYGAWAGGGSILPYTQTSGGVRLKGQIAKIENFGATINHNVSLYIEGGAGIGQDVRISASTIENPRGFGVLVQGVFNISVDVMHVYSGWANNGGTPNYWGWLIDGTYTVCQNITLNAMTPRSTVSDLEMVAFQCFGNNADRATIRVRGTTWKQWGYQNQYRFMGIDFDAVPQQCGLQLINNIIVQLRPREPLALGNTMPLRLTYGIGGQSDDGEWIAVAVPSSGVAIAPTVNFSGTRTNGSTSITAININAKRLPVGSLVTGAGIQAGTTIVSSSAPSQATLSLPALMSGGAAMVSALQPSALYYAYLYADNAFVASPRLLLSSTVPSLDPTGYMVKSDEPTALWVGTIRTDAAGDFIAAHDPGTYSKLFNWPSIAAGTVATTTITSCFGVAVGDIIAGVAMSIPSAGLIMSAAVNAAAAIDVTAFNYTAAPIDPPAALVSVTKIK